MRFKVGQQVNWLYQQRNGSGITIPVAGVVEELSEGGQIRIRIALPSGAGEWTPAYRWVNAESLKERSMKVIPVDGMQVGQNAG